MWTWPLALLDRRIPIPLARGAGVVFLVFVGTLYAGWMTSNMSEAEDSLSFFMRIETGTAQFHPHHLIFEPVYQVVLDAMRRLSGEIHDMRALQLLTAGFAVLGLSAVLAILSPRSGPLPAILATAFLAVSFGYWHYGTAIDAYVPALAFALLALLCFDRRPGNSSAGWAVLLGVLAALAVLMHQMYVFLAALMFPFVIWGGERRAPALKEGLIFGVTSGGLVLAAYVAAFLAQSDAPFDLSAFLGWALGYARDGLWDPPSALTPIYSALGLMRAIFTDIPFFGIEPVQDLIRSRSESRLTSEEVFAAKTALGPDVAAGLAVVGVLGLFAALAAVVLAFRPHAEKRKFDSLQWLLLVLILAYIALASVWEAINKEFWIHVVAFLAVLVGTMLSENRRPLLRLCTVAVVLIGISNFFGAIRPYSDPRNDFWVVRLAPLTETARPGDLVIIDCAWLCLQYARFLTGAEVVLPEGIDRTPMAATAYDRVLLSSWASSSLEKAIDEVRASEDGTGLRSELSDYGVPEHHPEVHQIWVLAETGWTRAEGVRAVR